jgi:hypothetical protein
MSISLCQSEGVVDTLVAFLRSSSVLETFEARSLYCVKRLMEKFVCGLAGCSTLKHLLFVLNFDEVDMEAMDVFVDFIRKRDTTALAIDTLKVTDCSREGNIPIEKRLVIC